MAVGNAALLLRGGALTKGLGTGKKHLKISLIEMKDPGHLVSWGGGACFFSSKWVGGPFINDA